jgi:hypothetical protein
VVHKASELREEVLDVSSANTGDICHREEGSEGGGGAEAQMITMNRII